MGHEARVAPEAPLIQQGYAGGAGVSLAFPQAPQPMRARHIHIGVLCQTRRHLDVWTGSLPSRKLARTKHQIVAQAPNGGAALLRHPLVAGFVQRPRS